MYIWIHNYIKDYITLKNLLKSLSDFLVCVGQSYLPVWPSWLFSLQSQLSIAHISKCSVADLKKICKLGGNFCKHICTNFQQQIWDNLQSGGGKFLQDADFSKCPVPDLKRFEKNASWGVLHGDFSKCPAADLKKTLANWGCGEFLYADFRKCPVADLKRCEKNLQTWGDFCKHISANV